MTLHMDRANLANLPADIILSILQHVAQVERYSSLNWWRRDREMPEGERLHAIQSVRLTCRALSQIATPILFPVLRVSINYRSVDAFDQLSKNPIIAAHTRGVAVNLSTYSSTMAMNLGIFKKYRYSEIDGLFYDLESAVEYREYDETDEFRTSEYATVKPFVFMLRHGWDRIVPMDDDDEVDEDDDEVNEDGDNINDEVAPGATRRAVQDKFGDILLRTHEEYGRRHREQLEWLNDTQAMQLLVTAFSRLKYGGRLQFLRGYHKSRQPRIVDFKLNEIWNNSQPLCHAMIQPSIWHSVDFAGDDNHFNMVKIPSRLPIALADAGVALTELYLGCFPHCAGFSQLFSHEKQQAAELELQLRSSFQHLQVFEFDNRDQWIDRHHPLSKSDLTYMRAYLQAAVASPQLQTLDLGFTSDYIYRTAQGITAQGEDDGMFRLGPVLQSCTGSQLTQVDVRNVEVKFDELEPLLLLLGANLSFLSLSCIKLLDGFWAPLLDTVHKRTAQRCQESRCRVSMSDFLGGEFGNKKLKEPNIVTLKSNNSDEKLKEVAILKEAEAYVCGKRATNPLQYLGAASTSPAGNSHSKD